METGEVIKFLRNKYNLTQDELAIKLRLNKSSIQKYESGAVNNLKMETLRDLCDLFKVPAGAFVFADKMNENDIDLLLKFSISGMTPMYEVVHLNDYAIKKINEFVRDLIDSGNYKST